MRQLSFVVGSGGVMVWLATTPVVCTSPLCQGATADARAVVAGAATALGTINDPLNVTERDGVPDNDLSGSPVITLAGGTSLKLHDQTTLQNLGEAPLLGTIVGATNPVLLGDGSPPAAFVSRTDGAVSRIHLNAMVPSWSTSVRRAGCGTDSMTAAPVVHLRRRGTGAFRAQYGHDLVYAGTAYGGAGLAGCAGASTLNQVVALRVGDGVRIWTFNGHGLEAVDNIVGMALDRSQSTTVVGGESLSSVQQEDTLFVTTERTASVSQHSVWAIDVLTGEPRWSGSFGRMTVSPLVSEVHDDRLYVVNRSGELTALRKTDGVPIWSHAETGMVVPVAAGLNRDVSEQRVVLVDALGRISLVRDNGLAAETLWKVELPIGPVPLDTLREPAVRATSAPLMDDPDRLYVGGSDGLIYQLDLDTGRVLATRTVNEARSAAVTQLSLVSAATVFEPAFLVAASSAGDLVRFCAPFCDSADGCSGGPLAADDSYTTIEDTPLAVDAPGVLLNDTGGPLSAALLTAPAHGTVSLAANGSLLYAPATDYAGPDGFTYVATNANGDSNVATVTLTVTPLNDSPIALDGSTTTHQGVPVTGSLAASDVDDAALTFALVATGSKGQAKILDAAAGTFEYVPRAGATGTDTFTFVASDGALVSNVATVVITITPSVLTVVSPDSGEQVASGTMLVIQWTYTGLPGPRVRIELLRGDSVERVIKANTSIGVNGQGSATWSVPRRRLAGDNFRIRITSTTTDGVSGVSGVFAISGG